MSTTTTTTIASVRTPEAYGLGADRRLCEQLRELTNYSLGAEVQRMEREADGLASHIANLQAQLAVAERCDKYASVELGHPSTVNYHLGKAMAQLQSQINDLEAMEATARRRTDLGHAECSRRGISAYDNVIE